MTKSSDRMVKRNVAYCRAILKAMKQIRWDHGSKMALIEYANECYNNLSKRPGPPVTSRFRFYGFINKHLGDGAKDLSHNAFKNVIEDYVRRHTQEVQGEFDTTNCIHDLTYGGQTQTSDGSNWTGYALQETKDGIESIVMDAVTDYLRRNPRRALEIFKETQGCGVERIASVWQASPAPSASEVAHSAH